jgi:hypothetical protein
MISLMTLGSPWQSAVTSLAAQDTSQAVPIWVGALVLFVGVFAILMVSTIVRQTARTQPSRSMAKEDEHIFAVPGLGTTMADGGDAADEKDQSK